MLVAHGPTPAQTAGVGIAREDSWALLRGVPLFSKLPDDALAGLAAGATMRALHAGDWLFRQGDEGSDLYVVASGRLETIVESPPPARVLRLLGPGEVVGELAVITGNARSASVRARRDSVLLEVSSEGIHDLLARHTGVALELLQVVARRLASGMPPPASGPRTVAVVDLREHIPDSLPDDLAEAFGPSVTTFPRAALPAATDPGRHLDALERRYAVVLLLAEAGDPVEWLRFCRRQADRVVAVAEVSGRPPTDRAELLAGCDLALAGIPSSAAGDWLEKLRPRAHHWLDQPDRALGILRLVRRITGRSTGVVLSGGGARGFAHLGVMERLRERGMTVDRIGGCSMGAFVGGLLAVGLSPQDGIEVCREEFVRHNPFNDYAVPRVSLIRARKASSMLQRVFGQQTVESCATDYFCVSSDLVAAQLVVHRRGTLWQSIGASMSIPGFAPPVELDGRLLVDGGVLDNLPVEAMAGTGEGPVIAVDVMGRTGLGQAGVRPTLVETLARSTVLGSWHRLAETSGRAELVITPEIPPMGLLDFRGLDEIVEAGRRAVDGLVAAGLV